MTIFGSNLVKTESDLRSFTGEKLPTSFNGVQVSVGGKSRRAPDPAAVVHRGAGSPRCGTRESVRCGTHRKWRGGDSRDRCRWPMSRRLSITMRTEACSPNWITHSVSASIPAPPVI